MYDIPKITMLQTTVFRKGKREGVCEREIWKERERGGGRVMEGEKEKERKRKRNEK